MLAFDALPPEVRRALANAAFSWAPQPFLARLQRGESVGSVVTLIENWDRAELPRTPRGTRQP
jgi:hypothetical protein